MPDNENLNPAEEPGTGTETGTEENTGAESGRCRDSSSKITLSPASRIRRMG